ncbi:myosin-IIIb-like, partial [Tachysurus ichikawai]
MAGNINGRGDAIKNGVAKSEGTEEKELYHLHGRIWRSLYGLYPYKSSMIRLEGLENPSDNWNIVETIGEGTYGKVFKITNKKDGRQAAAKVLDPVN